MCTVDKVLLPAASFSVAEKKVVSRRDNTVELIRGCAVLFITGCAERFITGCAIQYV
jgi:hypothetical protein